MKELARMKFLVLIPALTLAMTSIAMTGTAALAQFQVVEPRVEYLENPLGIEVQQPRLQWKLVSNERAQKQSAYRVLVASSSKQLAKNRGDLWDSGKVESDQTVQIPYQGKKLTSRQRCYWKVINWDQDGNASAWSSAAGWSMGLLEAADWQARWIGYDAIPGLDKEPASSDQFVIKIQKAIYGVPRNESRQLDLSETLTKLVEQGTYKFRISNDLAGRDPAPGIPKKLQLKYTLNGQERTHLLAENAEFDLVTGVAQRNLGTKRYLPSPHLRKDFRVAGKVNRAVIYVSAQGVFEMHLNGQRVGDEYLMPGWTDYRKRIYYRAYDVTKLLRKGENVIGGILGDGWFRGNISIKGQNQYGDKLRLLAQLHLDYAGGKSDVVATDSSWKASFGPIRESDMQGGETYDARLEMPGWDQAGFNDRDWKPVDTGSDLKPRIQSYPGVPVRATRELKTVAITQPQEGRHVFDLGQNFAGWVRLKAKGQAGDRIVMRFGEMLNPDGTVHTQNLRSARSTDTYICKGDGEETWEPHFTFHGFRYVEVAGLRSEPDPSMVTGIVVNSDSPLTSSFECSNPMLNQLHSNILWGQLSNYLEVPTDCPQRDERMGWTGDTQVFIRSGTYHQDIAAFFTKWMVDLADSVDGSGVYGNQAPVFHGHGSPGWSDAGIICPWTLYQVYGDTRILRKHYDEMARYLKACGRNGLDGLGAGFGDWLAVGSATPKELISVAYYAYSTQLMAKIAEVLDKPDDAKQYRELFNRIREHFQDKFVAADGKIAGDSQTAYCMALQYDLLTERQRQQAADHVVRRIEAKDYHLSVGFLGVQILLPTLTDIGRSDLAYRLLQNTSYPSWGYSVDQGATTIWERWNSYTIGGGINGQEMNSFNHYAYGACSEWMFYDMLGIDTAGSGFKNIKMEPQVQQGVAWAKGYYDSIQGRIGSAWKKEDGKFNWYVIIPPNTTATLHVPAKDVAGVSESGKPVSGIEEIRVLGTEGDRVLMEVGSGKYRFSSLLK